MSKKTNYLEPAVVFEELLKSIKAGRLSERMGEMIITISTRYATHPMFGGYRHIREELIHNGILACCKSYQSFRPNRNIIISRDPETNEITESQAVIWDGNIVPYDHNLHYSPFAFFTTVIKNSNIQYLKKYYQHKNLLNELLIEQQMSPDWGYEDMMKDRQRASCLVDEVDYVEIDVVLEEVDDELSEGEMDSETDSLDSLPDAINHLEISTMGVDQDDEKELGIIWSNR